MTTLITGANRGIGQAIHERIDGAIGTSRTGDAPLLKLDVTQPASHEDLTGSLNGQAIDLLICNAGVYLDKGLSLNNGYSTDIWSDTFLANVTGVFLTIETLLPNLKAAKGAKIAIISSQMASQTNAPGGAYAYRASKAAVLNLGRNLAKDLAADDISVGIYHPGWVRTDMGTEDADISVDESAEGLIARFNELSPQTTGCYRSYDGTTIPF